MLKPFAEDPLRKLPMVRVTLRMLLKVRLLESASKPSLRSARGSQISFSSTSKSILNAQRRSRASSPVIEESVMRNCSAVPRGSSGFNS